MKNLLSKRRTSGFTIIEVMIVLAIAGLIMVIVFIAVPQLQRQQRNESRRSVMNRIVTEVNNYSSNNQGGVPTADNNATTGFEPGGGFYVRYIQNNAAQFQNPQTGAIFTFDGVLQSAINAAVTGNATSDTAYYAVGATCQGETSVAGNARNFVVMHRLEGGAIYCVDNR